MVMPRRLARRILDEGRRGGHSRRQIRRAMSRLCSTHYIPAVPRGWAWPNWLAAHGIDQEHICVFLDQPDGTVLVRSYGSAAPDRPTGPSLDDHAPGPTRGPKQVRKRQCEFQAGCYCA